MSLTEGCTIWLPDKLYKPAGFLEQGIDFVDIIATISTHLHYGCVMGVFGEGTPSASASPADGFQRRSRYRSSYAMKLSTRKGAK